MAEERWRELRFGHRMKRLGRVWNEVVSFENLFHAYRKARAGKQSSATVVEFALVVHVLLSYSAVIGASYSA